MDFADPNHRVVIVRVDEESGWYTSRKYKSGAIGELTEWDDSAGEPTRTRAARPEGARGAGRGWAESISPSPPFEHAGHAELRHIKQSRQNRTLTVTPLSLSFD